MWITPSKVIAFAGLLVSLGTNAHCLDQERLTGVNLAGAEFNSKNLPGTINKDYVYPTREDIEFIAAQGANVIRLPVRWERIQPKLDEPLNGAQLGQISLTLSRAKTAGLCVILDMHNYGRYYDTPIASEELQKAFINVWRQLVNALDEKYFLALGLMNEPAHLAQPEWAALAKRTITELRKAGVSQLILVGGGNWNGLHSWFNSKEGISNANAFADLADPLNKTLIEVHQYADKNYSGTGMDCYPPEHFDVLFERIQNWAKEHGHQLFLGEFGFSTTPECLKTLDHFLHLMNNSNWKGWTYWASGRWWKNYGLALNASLTAPSPQWYPLKKAFYTSGDSEKRPEAPGPL